MADAKLGFFKRGMRRLAMRAAKWGGMPLRDPALVKMFGQGEDTDAGIDVNEKTAMNCSAYFACVNMIAGSMCQSEPVLYRETKEGKERAIDHPVYEMVTHTPNDEVCGCTFREIVQSWALNWGNGYAEIERDTSGVPLALHLLHPSRVKPGYMPNGTEVEYIVSPAPELGQMKEEHIPAKDMFHLRGLGDDALAGFSIAQQARQTLGLSLAGEKFGSAFFGRGSMPGGFIKHPGELSERAAKNLRESWEKMHRGPDNAHRIGILEEGSEFVPTSVPPELAQFLETRHFQAVEVCRWFNMPPHMIRDLTNATFSNIEHQSLEYLIHCLGPWFKRWNSEMRRKLLRPEERNKYFFDNDVAFLLKADMLTRFTAYQIARNGGWYSVNEILRRENLNPVPGEEGEALLVPVNMMTLGKLLRETPDAIDATAITQMVSVMTAVAAGTMNPQSAGALLRVVKPSLTDKQVADIIGPYGKGTPQNVS